MQEDGSPACLIYFPSVESEHMNRPPGHYVNVIIVKSNKRDISNIYKKAA